ncbi:MAG: universal stress protein [Desulfatiglandaceae bacterium]|jgi:nucleotide-binding universal stress UspA family protein
MEKKVLVAFDDSDNARRAVEFIARSFTTDHHITLFSVIPDTTALCQMTGFNTPTLTPYFLEQQGAFCALEEKKKNLIKASLESAEAVLIKAGFDKSNIKRKMIVEKKGAAKAIISEAKSGYHTIVLGRRGLSGVKEFFLGSVSQKVLSAVEDVSIILIK